MLVGFANLKIGMNATDWLREVFPGQLWAQRKTENRILGRHETSSRIPAETSWCLRPALAALTQVALSTDSSFHGVSTLDNHKHTKHTYIC